MFTQEEEETEEAPDPSGMQTPIIDAGLATPSGMSSVGAPGQETPELIELRKRRIEADMEGGDTPSLYTVLPEKKAHGVGASMMGSTHTYEVPPPGGARRIDPGGVEMALNPDEVDLMDTEAMQAKAEAALREQAASLAKEDFSGKKLVNFTKFVQFHEICAILRILLQFHEIFVTNK